MDAIGPTPCIGYILATTIRPNYRKSPYNRAYVWASKEDRDIHEEKRIKNYPSQQADIFFSAILCSDIFILLKGKRKKTARAFCNTTCPWLELFYLCLTHPQRTLLLAIDKLSQFSVPSFRRIKSDYRTKYMSPDLVKLLTLLQKLFTAFVRWSVIVHCT